MCVHTHLNLYHCMQFMEYLHKVYYINIIPRWFECEYSFVVSYIYINKYIYLRINYILNACITVMRILFLHVYFCMRHVHIYVWLHHMHEISLYASAKNTQAGWWFQPLWKILVSWGYYSQYMENNFHVPNHQPAGYIWCFLSLPVILKYCNDKKHKNTSPILHAVELQ